MIHSKFINYILFVVFLFSSTILFAQSDYEMVQSFKERNINLANSIKLAKSLEELDSLKIEIDNFKRDFSAKKFLLDQSLYPENFYLPSITLLHLLNYEGMILQKLMF